MDGNSKFLVFQNPMGILNQKNLWPTSIYQFEHTGDTIVLHNCAHSKINKKKDMPPTNVNITI